MKRSIVIISVALAIFAALAYHYSHNRYRYDFIYGKIAVTLWHIAHTDKDIRWGPFIVSVPPHFMPQKRDSVLTIFQPMNQAAEGIFILPGPKMAIKFLKIDLKSRQTDINAFYSNLNDMVNIGALADINYDTLHIGPCIFSGIYEETRESGTYIDFEKRYEVYFDGLMRKTVINILSWHENDNN